MASDFVVEQVFKISNVILKKRGHIVTISKVNVGIVLEAVELFGKEVEKIHARTNGISNQAESSR